MQDSSNFQFPRLLLLPGIHDGQHFATPAQTKDIRTIHIFGIHGRHDELTRCDHACSVKQMEHIEVVDPVHKVAWIQTNCGNEAVVSKLNVLI